MNWENININLGVLKENKTYDFEYKSTKDLLSDIVAIIPGCSNCTTIKGYNGNVLKVSYKTSVLPKHLDILEQKINKKITITYSNGTNEILNFHGILKK